MRSGGKSARRIISAGQGWPFLGAVEIVGHEGDQVHLRAEVRRLGDTTAAAEWLTATLVADATGPGGFAWAELQLPTWLLKSAD